MNQQQNTFKTMVDNESYLQNGMDINISDTESNVSTQDEIEIIIDRTPSHPNENEEHEDVRQSIEDNTIIPITPILLLETPENSDSEYDSECMQELSS